MTCDDKAKNEDDNEDQNEDNIYEYEGEDCFYTEKTSGVRYTI